MRRSRAGRTGGGWYGSYEYSYVDKNGKTWTSDRTNLAQAKKTATRDLKSGEAVMVVIRDGHSKEVLWERPKGENKISEQLVEALRDNQWRDLEALARQKKADAQRGRERYAKWAADQDARMAQYAKAGWRAPDWTRVKGILVLRAGNDDYVAVPANGKKNAARFSIIDAKKGEMVVPNLKKSEVREWLFRSWKSRHGF